MLRIIIILGVLILLALPFLPIKLPITLFWFNFPEEKRPRNLVYVASTLVVVLIAIILMPRLVAFAHWFATWKPIVWLMAKIPTHAHYSWTIFEAVVINVLFCLAAILANYIAGALLGRFPKLSLKNIRNNWREARAKAKQKREERRKRRQEKNSQEASEEKKNEEPAEEPEELPEHLRPQPQPADNAGKVRLLSAEPKKRFAGRAKGKNSETKQTEEATGIQKVIRKLLSPFYELQDGVWYAQPHSKKAAKHLRNFLILSGIFYLVLFALLMIPVFFKLDTQNAAKFYQLMTKWVEGAYLYPAVSMVLLLEFFWFMNGKLPEEPVTDIRYSSQKQRGSIVDLDQVEQQLMQTYGKEYEVKSFYSGDVEGQERSRIPVNTSDNAVLETVLEFVESEKLLRNDDYLRGLQALQMGKNVLFDAPLYTAVSMYLYPYLNIRISQGERMLVICQNTEDIPNLIQNLREGFRRVQQAHKCLWAIHDRAELRADNQTDILVVTPSDFLDEQFFTETADFAKRLTIALFPDADHVVATNNYLCVIMAQRLQEMCNSNRYSRLVNDSNRQVQYLFLSTRHMLNLARSLTEFFLLKEPVHDVQAEYAFGSIRLYVWRAKGQSRILLDNSAQTVKLETSISNIAQQNGIPKVTMFTQNAIFANQIDPNWLDAYDIFDRPIGFTVVSDDSYNLPSTIYTYSRYVGKEASVLHVISKDYMLRDYFYDNAVRSLFERPLMERGIAEHAQRNQAGTILLLCKLMAGIPVAEFVAKMAEHTGTFVSGEPTYPEIRKLVDACLSIAFGKPATADQYGFSLENRTDEQFNQVPFIQIREEGLLEHLIRDTQLVTVQVSHNGVQNVKVIPLFRRMLAQRYLPEQHMVIDHANYKIRRIDFENGVIYATAATSVHNVPDQYVQAREYTLRQAQTFMNCCNHYAAGEMKQLDATINGYQRRVEGRGQMQALTLVRGAGVLDIDSHTVAFYDSTNCPGRLNLMDASVFSVKTDLHRQVSNAMYLRFAGEFTGDDRLTMTLAILLQEMMKTMFPDQHFCVSVCPILRNPDSIYQHQDDHCRRIAQMYPKLHGWENCADNAIELLIVDDCEGGTGVLDILYDPEAVYLSNILDMLCDYLDWLEKHPENAYLYFGAKTCPSLFVLPKIRSLLDPFYRPYLREHDLFQQLKPSNVCTFCGKTLTQEDSYLWENRYNICGECNEEYIPSQQEAGWILNHIRRFLDHRFGVKLNPAICVVSDPATEISGVDIEAAEIRLNPALPLTAVHMELLRQSVLLWQMEYLRMTGEPEFAGQLVYVLTQYLEELEQYSIRKRIHGRALLQSEDAGIGYCRLRQALQAMNSDNSFRYMLENFRKGTVPPVLKTDPKRTNRKQNPEDVVYHYASRFSGEDREIYDLLYKGVTSREEEIDVSAYKRTKDQIYGIWRAMMFDHPEFHWCNYYHFSYTFVRNEQGGPQIIQGVFPQYWIDEQEQQRRQAEIDAVVPSYFAGITDETGDFEAALQVYINMAKEMDYDSIALDRQKKQRSADTGKPDELRNLYGALVQKKSVCAGYAIAYQYLLQKLGIEAITVTGDCIEGGPHAWNIINMEGKYYHVDVTWGDGSNTDPDKNRVEPSFGYFGLTDQDIMLSRTIDTVPEAPVCDSTDCNYFVRNGLYFISYDHMTVKKKLTDFLQDGTRERIDLRFSNAQVLEVAKKQLVYNGGIAEALRAANRKTESYSREEPKLNILSVFFEPTAPNPEN